MPLTRFRDSRAVARTQQPTASVRISPSIIDTSTPRTYDPGALFISRERGARVAYLLARRYTTFAGLLGLAVTATVAAVSVPTGIPAAADAPSRDSRVPLVTGTLLGPDAKPVPDAYVRIAAVPHPSKANILRPRLVAEGSTNAAGEFTLGGSLPAGQRMRGADGEITLEFFGFVDEAKDMAVSYLVDVDPDPVARAEVARKASASVAALSGQGLRLQYGVGAVHTPTEALAMLARGAGAGPEGMAVEVAPRREAAGSSPKAAIPLAAPRTEPAVRRSGPPTNPTCGRAVGYWKFTGKSRKRFVPIQRLSTLRHSLQTFELVQSKQTKLSAAYNNNGTKYAGGVVGSIDQRGELGQEWKIGNRKSKLAKPQWVHRLYRAHCVTGAQKRWVWYPYEATGYQQSLKKKKTNSKPSWICDRGNSGPITGRTWVVKEASVAWNGYFSYMGVGLNLTQQNSTTEKLTVQPDGDRRDPWLCGDNGTLVRADRIKEIYAPGDFR